MPIGASAGTLDIENATLRSNAIAVLTNLVAGNDQVRQSGPPALEVYGDPSHGGNEPRLELVSNIADTASNAFTRLTSNAGVFSIETGTSGTSDNGTITFGGFQNERLRITSDGNVGIGTDSPGAPLEIFTTTQGNSSTLILKRDVSSYGGSDDGAAIEFKTRWTGNNATYGQVRIRGVDDNLGDSGEGGIAFDTLQDQVYYERMRIKHNGNVGIGTTNPSSTLEVLGTNIAHNTTIYPLTVTTISSSSTAVEEGIGTGIEFRVERQDTDNLQNECGAIRVYGAAGIPSSSDYWNMAFRVKSNDTTFEPMTLMYNGNVGIGTANPKSNFHVGVENTSLRIGAVNYAGSAANTTTYGLERSRNQILFSTWRDAQTDKIGAKICGINKQTYSPAPNDLHLIQSTDLAFYTVRPNAGNYDDTSERLRITDEGRVGINDSTPSYTLDVNGTIRADNVSASSDDRIKYNEQNVSNALTLISQLNPQKYEKIMERPNPIEGTWIPTDEEWENVKGDYKHGDEFGFIAQDVRAVPELAFLVHGEETRSDTKTSSPEEYSNLTTEEQLTYTTSYTYESNTITQEEYSNLSPEEQGLYSTQYTKQIETQTPLALNYQGLFVVAIGAIKELKAKNDDLEARITALESA